VARVKRTVTPLSWGNTVYETAFLRSSTTRTFIGSRCWPIRAWVTNVFVSALTTEGIAALRISGRSITNRPWPSVKTLGEASVPSATMLTSTKVFCGTTLTAVT
jgi:hypothetical protein